MPATAVEGRCAGPRLQTPISEVVLWCSRRLWNTEACCATSYATPIRSRRNLATIGGWFKDCSALFRAFQKDV